VSLGTGGRRSAFKRGPTLGVVSGDVGGRTAKGGAFAYFQICAAGIVAYQNEGQRNARGGFGRLHFEMGGKKEETAGGAVLHKLLTQEITALNWTDAERGCRSLGAGYGKNWLFFGNKVKKETF